MAAAINDDSASSLVFSLIPSTASIHTGSKQRTQARRAHQQRNGSTSSSALLSDYDEQILSGSRPSIITGVRLEKFKTCIEREYKELQKSDGDACYFIANPHDWEKAQTVLQRATHGTFFVRPAREEEHKDNKRYFLNFVCHQKCIEVPICCDEEHRTFWFLSGGGHGSEVMRTYSGIDIMIEHKQRENFYELIYPFRISLYRPLDDISVPLITLPDRTRSKSSRDTILHELAARGWSDYLTTILSIAQDSHHVLHKICIYLVDKINRRNPYGQTPLMLAVQSGRHEFIEALFSKDADVHLIDIEGCSTLHYACRIANPKILKRLIVQKADPHYVNTRESKDGNRLTNLSAFHYLAMAIEAPRKNIKQCVRHLLGCGCPLLPLTSNGYTPFHIAELYGNNTFDCVKTFFPTEHPFNSINALTVSSRDQAKTILSNVTCRTGLGKMFLRIKRVNIDNCRADDGLFLIYQIPNTIQNTSELGLFLYHKEQIYHYGILTSKPYELQDTTSIPPRKIAYKYCLTKNNISCHPQSALFRSLAELVHSHTKHKGMLAGILKHCVMKNTGEILENCPEKLPLPNKQLSNIDDGEVDSEPEPASPGLSEEFNVNQIIHFDFAHIHSGILINRTRRRFIWKAHVRKDWTGSFPIVIKDYTPMDNIEQYEQFRLDEFNLRTRRDHPTTRRAIDASLFEFSTRSCLEHKFESTILLNELKNHPLIVHTFICDHQPTDDLRIFMEYLPMGNLHVYLRDPNVDLINPLDNAFHWIYQLAQAMAFVSNKKIVHRDLATRNILLNSEQHIKLSDFGLSRRDGTTPDATECILPPRWTAPECFDRNQIIRTSADVWSFGVVLWEIYSFGALPYLTEIGTDETPQLLQVLKTFLTGQGRRLAKPEKCSESIYDLMFRCFNVDHEKRPHFVDIINELNNISARKDRVVSFTRHELRHWKSANETYVRIRQQFQTTPADPGGYMVVEDDHTEEPEISVRL